MACSARVNSGVVRVSTSPEPGARHSEKPIHYDRSIGSVVVIGNGIAGVTAADFVRRGHPECEIHVVGSESHVLYNRMGISRLVFGRSAMQGLYLLPEQWYDDHQVIAWLNTRASRIDPPARRVSLATGDTLHYDRLILAMGSSSTRPPVTGFGHQGSFVLRSAADAMQVRAYAQEHGGRTAVVAGGGLLGLEGAHALHELGLDVTVLERGGRLMAKQIDERCSELVDAHLSRIGLHVQYRAESDALTIGDGRVRAVTLKDGRTLPCDIFLAAVGIRPNAELAKEAGIAVNRGVIVNDRMETSVPGIFAAGDVAEHDGMVLGLWPIAAKQGEVAAVNALGGPGGAGGMSLTAEIPATILKGVGVDVFSIGQFAPGDNDTTIVADGPISLSRDMANGAGHPVTLTIVSFATDSASTPAIAMSNNVTLPDDVEVVYYANHGSVKFSNLKHFTGTVYASSITLDQQFTLTFKPVVLAGFNFDLTSSTHFQIQAGAFKEVPFS